MQLVQTQAIRFGKPTSTPTLICNRDEAENFEKFLTYFGCTAKLCDSLDCEDEWMALYNKLADIAIEERSFSPVVL